MSETHDSTQQVTRTAAAPAETPTNPAPQNPVAGKPGWSLRFRLRLRRFPILHGPARWLNRVVKPSLLQLLLEIPRKLIPSTTRFGLAKGSYSDLELLTSTNGNVEGRCILRDQGNPALPNPSIMLQCKRSQHLEQPWPIFWMRHRRARLIGPSLVHINKKKELSSEACYGPHRVKADPAYRHFSMGKPVVLSGAWTSIISRWSPVHPASPYGHWILDALPRLAVLPEFPPGTKILVAPQRTRYQVESLKALGLLEHCRWTHEEHLELEDYFFSAPTSMIVCHNPYAVEFLRRSFLPQVHSIPISHRRVFITRKTFGRGMVNEAEVVKLFDDLGWTVVDTAALGFLEQVKLFAEADALCVLHGSSIQNTVWCKPGCVIVELFADAHLGGDGEWIAQCTGARYSYLVFPSDHLLNARVDVRRVREHLKSQGLD